jgi:hypothetical protein
MATITWTQLTKIWVVIQIYVCLIILTALKQTEALIGVAALINILWVLYFCFKLVRDYRKDFCKKDDQEESDLPMERRSEEQQGTKAEDSEKLLPNNEMAEINSQELKGASDGNYVGGELKYENEIE